MRNLYILTLILFCVQYAQAQFENGYYIRDTGEKQSVLIKNENWKKSPEQIYFKTDPQATETRINIKNLSEFGIDDDVTFIIRTVDIEVSSENISKLTDNKSPVFESQKVALRKIVEGTIALYEYQFDNGNRYFVKEVNQELVPLIYKKYLVTPNQIAVNAHYKQQLSLMFSEKSNVLQKELERLTYTRSSLSKIIAKYSSLNNQTATTYTDKVKNKTRLGISAYAGLEQISASYQFSDEAPVNPSFDNMNRYYFGAELELLILNERLGFFTGYSFKSKISEPVILQTSVAERTQTATFNYDNNSWTIGARGYIPIVENIDLTVSAGLTREHVSDFSIRFEISSIDENYDRNGTSRFLGLGMTYKRFFAEARYLRSTVFEENATHGVPIDYSFFNFRLGYKIL